MAIYTSRYSNPELKSGNYTTVRISVDSPKGSLGYIIDGDIPDLMPFGLRGEEYDKDKALFKREYFARLEKAGVAKIQTLLLSFKAKGKDVVLLCYEDIRKGDNYWCHRVMFAEWWLSKTGEHILELADTTTPVVGK